MREMRKFVILLAFAVVMSSAISALAGCGPPAPGEQAVPLTDTAASLQERATPATTAEPQTRAVAPTDAATSLQERATPATTAEPQTGAVAPTSTSAPQRATATPESEPSGTPTAPLPDPTAEDGLEFLSVDSFETLGRDGGITGVSQKPSKSGDSPTGPVQGQTFTWEDGDRTLTAYLQTDLVVEKDSRGFPGSVVASDAGGSNVVRSADGQSKGNTLPVFRSEYGELLTLPGGVLLVLSAEWSQAETNSFFASNGIKTDRVSELSYAVNGFFVETEAGFPSLDLANRLATQEGVELSSPNWGREAVPK